MNDLDFYELEARDEQLRFLVQFAMLTPSRHDEPPPRLRIVPDGIEVSGDAWLTVGAAIANLRIAAAHFGFESTVLYGDPILVALRETCATDDNLRALFPAIRKRHSNHSRFCPEPLSPEAINHLCDLADRYPETLSLFPRRRVRDLSLGYRNRKLLESAAALILVSAEDDRISMVQAGEVLELLLLRVTLDGLDYSLFDGVGDAKLLIRVGRSVPSAAHAETPRETATISAR